MEEMVEGGVRKGGNRGHYYWYANAMYANATSAKPTRKGLRLLEAWKKKGGEADEAVMMMTLRDKATSDKQQAILLCLVPTRSLAHPSHTLTTPTPISALHTPLHGHTQARRHGPRAPPMPSCRSR